MHVVESGPEDGVPVVLLHGNLSTGRFYEHLFDGRAGALPAARARHARLRRHRARADRRHARAARLGRRHRRAAATRSGIDAPPHLAGWSTGGAAIAAFALERPVASLTFIDPVGPYGYGATKLDGTPHYADFAGSGGGTGNPEFTARLAAGDRSAEGDTAPRNVHEQLLLAPEPPRAARARGAAARRDPQVGHRRRRLPGRHDALRALARRRARARAGSSTRSRPSTATGRGSSTSTRSRRSCGRTARTTSWSPTARRGRWARSASSASCPGWPGEDAFPPQPMVAQIRARARALRGRAAAAWRCELFEGSGHFPPIDARERWSARFFGFLESVG